MTNSSSQNELNKAEKQFKDFENDVKDLTLDRMNEAPRAEQEQQTRMSSREMQKSNEVYLKPEKRISCRDKFNEKFRATYEYEKEYVNFVAEHKESPGDDIETWTRPRGGIDAEFWRVPAGRPVWGPRYLADRIKGSKYHRLTMKNTVTETHQMGQMYGTLVADTTIQRLDAYPVSDRRSIFMGASGF